MAYLGEGHGAMAPPFGRTIKIFYRRLYMKRFVFAIFQQELQNSTMFDGLLRFQISEKMGEFAVSIEHSEAKSVSALGRLCLLTPDQGLCPWSPLGASPPDPRYRLALRALAMPPLCQILNTPLMALYDTHRLLRRR